MMNKRTRTSVVVATGALAVLGIAGTALAKDDSPSPSASATTVTVSPEPSDTETSDTASAF